MTLHNEIALHFWFVEYLDLALISAGLLACKFSRTHPIFLCQTDQSPQAEACAMKWDLYHHMVLLLQYYLLFQINVFYILYFRIFQTMPSIQCPFFHFHRNGYGVSHGVVMPQNLKQKLLIFATIQ